MNVCVGDEMLYQYVFTAISITVVLRLVVVVIVVVVVVMMMWGFMSSDVGLTY